MSSGQWAVVLRHVQRLFHGESVSGLSEGQLLDRFVATRDEVAFGAIVARHGPMVLGVCRGVLDDPHDVEDAFQATFLILVKKAAALRDRDLLGQWLYGVARRVSLRARADCSRRRAKERPEAESVDPVATLDADLRELQVLIREEVDRLSSNDRIAVVLCYLEGLTHEEAADRLGWPVGTVKGRLSRAREKLRARLTRRGVALPAAAIASTLARGASAAIPLHLLRSTTLAATRLAAGQTLAAGIVSAHAITLMEGVIGTMFMTKLKIGAAALVATCVLAVPGVLAYQGVGPSGEERKPAAGIPNPPVQGEVQAKGPAQFGLSKMQAPQDSDSKREELSQLSRTALTNLERLVADGKVSPASESFSVWSRRLAEAQTGPNAPEPARKAALQAHLDRIQKWAGQVKRSFDGGKLTAVDVLEAQFRLIDAERWVREGKITDGADRPPMGGEVVTSGGFGGGGGFSDGGQALRRLVIKTMPGDEKRNQAILAKLEEIVSMKFPNETPLEDVKKYIEQSTQDEKAGLPTGIPIYVDPVGLMEADKTISSTVAINLEGIPLRTTLHLILHQLGLAYKVEGGLLIITDEETANPTPPAPTKEGMGGMGGGFR